MKLLLLLFVFIGTTAFITPEAASEKLFKEMIANRPNHLSQPGENRSITFHEFKIAKPVNWTMEFGRNAGADKNTKVYKVIARFTLATETYNTATKQKYSSTNKEYNRAYNFYVDKSNEWVCVALGLSKGLY